MFNKYIQTSNRLPGTKKLGKGNTIRIPYTDPFERERYYAFTKHRAQANFRGEPYELTHEDWCELWPYDKFVCRGRGGQDLCLSRQCHAQSWNINNVKVCTRREHLKRNGEFRRYE
jgi:hypothetical protein